MSTPPNTPPPSNPGGPTGPFPPGDPRNQPYTQPFSTDPRVRREQERAWAQAQKDQARAQREQAKAWTQYQREASRQQVRAAKQQARLATEAQRAQLRAYRRSNRAQSIIGPLLLIGIAVVALMVYSGHIALSLLLSWFARWWPLVLIAAGVLRLVEWGIARATTRNRGVPMRFAVGGSTVWLLILISLFGLAAQGGLHRVGDNWTLGFTGETLNQIFGSKHEEDAAAVTHSIAANGTLEIHNDHGDVTVDGTSDDGLIHLSEHKEVFANTDDRAASMLSDLTPQFTGTDSELVLRIASSDHSSAALSLTVPRGVHIVLNSNHGDAAVHSFHAPVAINANRGDVDVAAITGDVQVRCNARHGSVQIHSVQGAIQLSGSGDEVNLNDINGTVNVNGQFFGSGHLQHVSGPVTYNAGRINFAAQRVDGEVSFDSDDEFTARGASGPLAVHTRSRNITLDRVTGDLQVTNSSGSVDITAVAPVGAINVDNRDGDVTLSLPASAHFTLAAETSDGTVENNFPNSGTTTNTSANSSRRGTLSAAVGSGGPAIHLMTTHGNIALERNGQVPMAPMAPVSPVPPVPPMSALANLPPDARQSLKDAQKEIADAQKEASRAKDEALKEAAQARADALKEAAQARAEGQRQAEQARAEADRTRQEALRDAAQARKEAEQERQQAQREAERAREEAQREGARARQEAERARRQSTPAPQTPPQ
ncbi:DUF4097 family beta strand repeat-containing protein [Terriglobus aquaticus]|uniref:DUF4097 family beta strand repeat-containing protein n=1 Tax=Terriglobus aquaticus TaxID=940139 RepID=A0ABW9KJ90_9BACT|nr:DUF4097 family beta strand repeat-containing protein [Terriglobus aquaticus]